MSARKVVVDRDGGLVVSKRRVAEIPLIDGREQERRVGKELLSILAREDRRRAADRHDQVRLGTIDEGGSDVVDDRLFRRADKPCRTHHDLDDVHGRLGALVQFDAEVAGELVDRPGCRGRTIAAPGPAGPAGRPRSPPPRAPAEPVSATRGNLRPGPVSHTKRSMGPTRCLLCARIYISCRTMKLLLAAALMLFCVAGSAAAQSVAAVVGSVVDQTGAPLPGVRVTIRGVADPHGGHRRRGRLRVSRPPGRRLRDFRGTERLRAAGACRARAGGRTGHRVLHLASRPRWKRRSSRPQRRAGAMFKRLPSRSVPSRKPISAAWEPRPSKGRRRWPPR